MVTPSNADEADALVFQAPHPIMRQRHSSIGNPSTNDASTGDGTAAATFAAGARKTSGKQSFQVESQGSTGGVSSSTTAARKTTLTKAVSSMEGGVLATSANGSDSRKMSVGNHSDLPVDAFINSIFTRHAKEKASKSEKPRIEKPDRVWATDRNSNRVRNSNSASSVAAANSNGARSSHEKENGTVAKSPEKEIMSSDEDEHPLVSAVTPTNSETGTNCTLM